MDEIIGAAGGEETVLNYRRSAALLKRDIEHAIADLSFEKRRGKIIRAVDFSEIYAFVLPLNEDYSGSWLPGLTKAEAAILDVSVLRLLFFGEVEDKSVPTTVLLDPHKFELRNAQPIFHRTTINQFRNVISKAKNELNKLHLDQKLSEIIERFEKYEENTSLFEEIRADLVAYLNEHAADLLLLTYGPDFWSPQTRLRRLLQDARLADLREVAGREISPDELDYGFVDSIQEKIRRRRLERLERVDRLNENDYEERRNNIEATSRIDALAAGYVLRANDIFSRQDEDDSQRRLVLVTRSEIFHNALGEYSEEKQNARLESFFRRPRAYGAALLQPGSGVDDRLSNLRQRKIALDLALRGLPEDRRPWRREDIHSAHEAETVNEVKEISRLWRGAANLALASENWEFSPMQVNSKMAQMIDLLRDKHSINVIIRDAAVKVAAEINLTNALLGRFEPRDEENTRSAGTRIESVAGGARSGSRVFVWSKNTPRTIGLFFYNPVVRQMRLRGGSGERALERLLEVKRIYHASGVDDGGILEEREAALVESCLASSFLEAVNDRWSLAELYADLAVNWSPTLDPTPRHEALYMRAVCRRRAEDVTEERLRLGLADLEAALQDLRRVDRSPGKVDARYLFEKGVHLFGWWEHLEQGNSVSDVGSNDTEIEEQDVDSAGRQSARLREAVNLFSSAKELLDEEVRRLQGSGQHRRAPPYLARQLLDVANALCYVRIETGKHDGTAVRLLAELRDAIQLCGWTEETVPLSILDTLCWSLFKLRSNTGNVGQLISCTRILQRRLPDDDRPESDKRIMEEHLAIIDAEIGMLK